MHPEHHVSAPAPLVEAAAPPRPGVLPAVLLIGCVVLFLGGIAVIRSADVTGTPRGCLAPRVVADGKPLTPACESSGNVATPVTPCSAGQESQACAPFRRPVGISSIPAVFSTRPAALR